MPGDLRADDQERQDAAMMSQEDGAHAIVEPPRAAGASIANRDHRTRIA
jgi:hypothetical protein